MTSEVQPTYYEWQHRELPEQEDSQELSISQMIDHGSISFGRFATESLSWKRRSVFTHNELQEELEKFKSPGLVAKKKAYFEEYYRKIRALKAARIQQTELSLEYGADGSISSQTGDEDEPPLPNTIPDKMPESISDKMPESISDKMPESISEAPLDDLTVKETIAPYRSCCKNKEENPDNSVEVQNFDSEISAHILSTETSQENGTNLKIEPDLIPQVCSAVPAVSNTEKVDLVTVDNTVLEENKLVVQKPKEGLISVPMSKEHAASSKFLTKSVNKSLSERIKSSLGKKHLLQKIIDKADIDITLVKKTSKNISNDQISFFDSHRSVSEVQNKAISSKPRLLSTERKGGIPADARYLNRRSESKNSNKSETAKFNTEGKLRRVHGEDSRMMASQNANKNIALQSKSIGHEEFKKNLGSKWSAIEGRVANEQLKTRSINLPSRNNRAPIAVASHQSQSSTSGDKNKKENASTTKKYERKDSKVTTLRHSGSIKVDTIKKQVTTVEKNASTSKQSLDGKKYRKENPRWR